MTEPRVILLYNLLPRCEECGETELLALCQQGAHRHGRCSTVLCWLLCCQFVKRSGVAFLLRMGNEPASQKPSHSNLDAAQFKPGFLILLCLGLASCRGVKRSDSGRSATGRTYVSTPASGLTVFMHAGSAKMKLYLKNTSALSQKSSKRSPSMWKFAPWRAYGFWYSNRF